MSSSSNGMMMGKLKRFAWVWMIGFLFAAACDKDKPDLPAGQEGYDWSAHQAFESNYVADFLPVYEGYEAVPETVGLLRLDESSGVCASINNPGMLWTHEDSGNTNFIYLVDAATAEVVCRYRVTGATNQDWEDIEIVKDAESGKAFLYISDTGDNDQKRQVVSVYQLEEPVYTAADYGKTLDLQTAVSRYTLSYPDRPHDVEGMFVDPERKDIYFVTKRDAVSKVYVMPYPYTTESVNASYHVGDLGFREASAATLNFSGNKLIVRNRQNLFYWERKAGETIAEMMKRTPQRLPYAGDVQGEAVCFDKDDNYYTTSERSGLTTYPPVYKYIRK